MAALERTTALKAPPVLRFGAATPASPTRRSFNQLDRHVIRIRDVDTPCSPPPLRTAEFDGSGSGQDAFPLQSAQGVVEVVDPKGEVAAPRVEHTRFQADAFLPNVLEKFEDLPRTQIQICEVESSVR